MPDALQKAREAVYGSREQQYGSPSHNIETVAEYWKLYLERKHGIQIAMTTDDVCEMMILLKISRLMHSPDHVDSLVDIMGWAAVKDRINTYDGQMELPLST